jgi:hypothetical protein
MQWCSHCRSQHFVCHQTKNSTRVLYSGEYLRSSSTIELVLSHQGKLIESNLPNREFPAPTSSSLIALLDLIKSQKGCHLHSGVAYLLCHTDLPHQHQVPKQLLLSHSLERNPILKSNNFSCKVFSDVKGRDACMN